MSAIVNRTRIAMDNPEGSEEVDRNDGAELGAKKPKKRAKPKAKKKAKRPAKPKTKAKAKKRKVVKAKSKKKTTQRATKLNAAIARPERLDMRLTKAQKAKVYAKAKKTRRTITSLVIEAIEKIR
jgi:hypothetical protein